MSWLNSRLISYPRLGRPLKTGLLEARECAPVLQYCLRLPNTPLDGLVELEVKLISVSGTRNLFARVDHLRAIFFPIQVWAIDISDIPMITLGGRSRGM